MSDWWFLLTAFWLWFLLDGVKFSRRYRFAISSWFSRKHGRVTEGELTYPPFLPGSWHVTAEDIPFSLSPEGLCNMPAGACGRPAPLPDAVYIWRWEEIQKIEKRRGYILINARPFCRHGGIAQVKTLEELTRSLQPLSSTERTERIEKLIGGWFRPSHLQRQLKRMLKVTRSLTFLNALGFLGAFGATLYFLGISTGWVGSDAREIVGRYILPAALTYLILHVSTLVEAWMAHRRIFAKKTELRVQWILSAAMLPPQTYRMRAQLAAAISGEYHPLTWMTAGACRDDFVKYARNALTDLRWPLATNARERGEFAAAVVKWFSARLEAKFLELLALRGVAVAEIFRAPERLGSEACRFCPRCGSQFVAPLSHCPKGVPLENL